MRNIFKKRRLSKWIPLGTYTFSSEHFVVMIRKNIDTGMLHFKRLSISRSSYSNIFIPNDLIDVKKAWEDATN